MSVLKLRPITNQPLTSRAQAVNHHNTMTSPKNPLMTTRLDFKPARQNSQSIHPFPKTSTLREWSKPHLLTLRKSIEQSCCINTKVREQLKMQKQNSYQVLSQIKSFMIETEQAGIDLVSKYEEEKCKHNYLVKLVDHYKNEIESQKQGEHQKVMQKTELNQYDQLNLELKQKQKLLEKITDKLNSFQCEKMSKYEIVKAERRERTVFSNQFNKFENEHFSLSQKYKQSLIERVLLEKQFNQKKEEFLKVQNEWKKHTDLINYKGSSRIKMNVKQPNFNADQSHDPKYEEFRSQLMIEPSFIKSRSRFNYTKMEKTDFISKNQLTQISEKKLLNLDYKKKLQLVLNDLGLKDVAELHEFIGKHPQSFAYSQQDYYQNHTQRQDCLSTVQLFNKKHNQELEKLEDTISEWQIKLNDLKKLLKSTTQPQKLSRQRKLSLNRIKQKKLQLSSLSQNLHSTNEEITQLYSSQNLLSLMKTLNLHTNSQLCIQESLTLSDSVDLTTITQIEQNLFSLLDKANLQGLKLKPRQVKTRRSFVFESLFTHPQQKDSLAPSQRTICPNFQPIKPQSKRTKATIAQHIGDQPLKKLSSLLRNQSRIKGPTDIASKDQMIKEATQAFGKEGIIRSQNFQVRYC